VIKGMLFQAGLHISSFFLLLSILSTQTKLALVALLFPLAQGKIVVVILTPLALYLLAY
jgi:hypothetical protein